MSPEEEARERAYLAYLCDVAACLATIAWPESVEVVVPLLDVVTERRMAAIEAARTQRGAA